jgi:N-dimethylarginine dimethylaminohydrolase
MIKEYGGQSMVAPLRRVLVRRPDEAFGTARPEQWGFRGQPYLPLAQVEHDAFCNILLKAGVEVVYHEAALPAHADSIFVHDPVLTTDEGAILLRMGKALRRGEEEAIARTLQKLEIPIYGALEKSALAEGGDILWLDSQTLAVGLGFRTNGEGANQLAALLDPLGVTVLPFHLPYYTGPSSCLHLMSLLSLVAEDLAVVYRPLLPVPLYQLLLDRGVQLVDVPDEEFETLGPNVLALAPRKCLMLEHNPITQRHLEEAGCQVFTYRGDEMSLKGEGGATCLTRPLLRR